MKILVSGSLCFDKIMNFPGYFKDNMKPAEYFLYFVAQALERNGYPDRALTVLEYNCKEYSDKSSFVDDLFLADAYFKRGEFELAKEKYQYVIDICKFKYGTDHRYAMFMINKISTKEK